MSLFKLQIKVTIIDQTSIMVFPGNINPEVYRLAFFWAKILDVVP